MKSKKKSKKKLIIVLVLLVICFLFVLAYFLYENFFENHSDGHRIITAGFESVTDNNKVYQGSQILTKGEYNYLVVRKGGKWYEIQKNTSEDNIGYRILGAYNDKLYYSDSSGINYIDVANDFKVVSFAYQDDCYADKVFMATFSDNKMYVEVDNSSSDDQEENYTTSYSIIEYDLKDNYKNKKGKKITVIKEGPVNFYVIHDRILYLDSYKDEEYKLMMYLIPNKVTSTVMKNVCGIDKYKDYLIFTKIDSDSEDEVCSLYYFYNVNYDKYSFITNKESHVVLNNKLYFQDNKKVYLFDEKESAVKYIADGKMNYTGNSLYYLNDNKIYKYENDNKTLVYSEDNDYKIRGFSVDSTTGEDILFIYTKNGSFVIVDGKKYNLEKDDNDFLMYKVQMKDGSTETFNYYGFNDKENTSDSNIVYDEYLDEEQ